MGLRGRVSVTPELLFLQCTVGLICLYCLDYYIGGERGLSPFRDSVMRGNSQTHTKEGEVHSNTTSRDTVAAGRISGTNTTELNALKEGDSLIHTGARTLLGGYVIMYMLMLMCMFLIICVVMCKKISQRVRSTTVGREGGTNNSLIRLLTNLANTRHVGNAAERERLRSTLRLMRRAITPEDYETLLALDAQGDFAQPRMGVSQALIDRCPVMKLTQAHIAKWSSGSNKGNTEVDQLPLAINEEASGSGRSPVHNRDSYACTVCLDDYKGEDEVRTLPCMHQYHVTCIDPWLLANGDCPMCKRRIDDDSHVQV
jgi:E3 ubiquitin-protein ligase SDIR1